MTTTSLDETLVATTVDGHLTNIMWNLAGFPAHVLVAGADRESILRPIVEDFAERGVPVLVIDANNAELAHILETEICARRNAAHVLDQFSVPTEQANPKPRLVVVLEDYQYLDACTVWNNASTVWTILELGRTTGVSVIVSLETIDNLSRDQLTPLRDTIGTRVCAPPTAVRDFFPLFTLSGQHGEAHDADAVVEHPSSHLRPVEFREQPSDSYRVIAERTPTPWCASQAFANYLRQNHLSRPGDSRD
ncbi:hypothetical protein GOEFS_051_00200 [Gordonia effusa NBRC 100432]|uniref:Uncharacterized protein n=1 Tax=Gordonia effusa NBRC 100432 TaxID=1077974 RepID=H0QZS4_9ACTN|nr:hypothetical protein [Gordonia effusa]GAB18325.1 hypothetical protein GOEFS_051_00200 [Gordonia effusa NBRC 100432]